MRFPAIVLTFSTQLFFYFLFWRERYNRFWLDAFIELFQKMRILVFELPVKQPVTKGGSRIHVCLKEMKICIVIHDRTARPLKVQTDAAKLQNTRPLLCISLNNKSAYCVIPRSLKRSDKCKWCGRVFWSCSNGRNNSQYCYANNVACFSGVKTDATCNIQQCCVRLHRALLKM